MLSSILGTYMVNGILVNHMYWTLNANFDEN